jgi:hypothetical protein
MKFVRLITMCLSETYGKACIGEHVSYSFLTSNALKQGESLSPLLFNFALKYATRTVQVNQVGLTMNETYQDLAYADDVNLQGDNTNTTNKNTEPLTDASKVVGL